MKSQKGFTLIETLAVIAIIAILGSLGAPSLHAMLQKQKIESARQELVGLAQMARALAINEGNPTALCGSRDGAICDGTRHWQGHVIAFVDANGNHTRDAAEAITFRHPLGEARLFGTRALLEFNASGAGYMGSWAYCPPDLAVHERSFRLILSLGGRLRTETIEAPACS